MKKNYLIFMVLLLGAVSFASAQISGTVIDENGVPLGGASIVKKGTTTGTTTDFDGNFSIDAIIGESLVVSYIGFEQKVVVIN